MMFSNYFLLLVIDLIFNAQLSTNVSTNGYRDFRTFFFQFNIPWFNWTMHLTDEHSFWRRFVRQFDLKRPLNSGSKQSSKVRLNRSKLYWVRGRTAYKYDREKFWPSTSRYEVQPWIQGTTYYLRYEPRLSTRYDYIETIYHEMVQGTAILEKYDLD